MVDVPVGACELSCSCLSLSARARHAQSYTCLAHRVLHRRLQSISIVAMILFQCSGSVGLGLEGMPRTLCHGVLLKDML